MAEFESEAKLQPDGSVRAVSTYPERVVEVSVSGLTKKLGTEPKRELIQLIPKENVPTLIQYLKEQREEIMERKRKADEVLEDTKGFDSQAVLDELAKYPTLEKLKGDVNKLMSVLSTTNFNEGKSWKFKLDGLMQKVKALNTTLGTLYPISDVCERLAKNIDTQHQMTLIDESLERTDKQLKEIDV